MTLEIQSPSSFKAEISRIQDIKGIMRANGFKVENQPFSSYMVQAIPNYVIRKGRISERD